MSTRHCSLLQENPASRREAGPSADEYGPLHVYGRAAGNLVALIEAASEPEGHTLKVMVGLADGNEIGAVAVMPPTREGRADADITAMAVLRTLEIVERDKGPVSA